MKVISRHPINELLARRDQVEKLRSALKEAESEENELSQLIIDALRNSARISAMPWTIEIQVSERRSPAYKEVLLREKGQEFVEQVIASTTPKVFEKLVIRPSASLKGN
jgi:hypothetical protein